MRRSEQLDLLFYLTVKLMRLPASSRCTPRASSFRTRLCWSTPVQASEMGVPMSQFDKHGMDPMGLIKLDLLDVRVQSAITHAAEEHRTLSG